MASRDTKNTIRSLERGLLILSILRDGESSVTEIARQLKVDKSTAYRLLTTLEARGYVVQSPRSRKYRLGTAILSLAGTVLNQLDLRAVARPHLEKLAAIGETVFLGLLDGKRVIYVDKIRSKSPLTVTSEVGSEADLHCTATAKAILAFLPEDVAMEALEEAPRHAYTPRTMTRPEVLRVHLEQIRARGYAVDDEELCIGLRCVAAPVFNHLGQVVGSVCISGPSQRVTLDAIDELGRRVKEAADRISRELGYVPAAANGGARRVETDGALLDGATVAEIVDGAAVLDRRPAADGEVVGPP